MNHTDAFFVVTFLSPDWTTIISLQKIIIITITSILLYIVFFIIKKILAKTLSKKTIPQKTIYTFPQISDINFLESIFLLLQQFAYEKYIPKNAFAHTYKDIAKYCNNKKFLETYSQVENLLFVQKNISEHEKEKILSEVKNILHI